MLVFENTFLIPAPLKAVAAFHRNPQSIRKLAPPLTLTKIKRADPLAEGSRTEFTVWFGLIPVRWVAVHSHVDRLHGFTAVQESGPMAYWRHVHAFDAVDAHTTRVRDTLHYSYPSGLPGFWARILVNRVALQFWFAHRARVIQRWTGRRH